MEANGSGPSIEGTCVGADHSLAKVRKLQPLVDEIALDELRHRPLEKKTVRLGIACKEVLKLLVRRRIADPQIFWALVLVASENAACRPKRISQSANHVAHRPPAFDISGREAANLLFASRVIVPELDAAVVRKRHKETVDGRLPIKAPVWQIQFLDHQR